MLITGIQLLTLRLYTLHTFIIPINGQLKFITLSRVILYKMLMKLSALYSSISDTYLQSLLSMHS